MLLFMRGLLARGLNSTSASFCSCARIALGSERIATPYSVAASSPPERNSISAPLLQLISADGETAFKTISIQAAERSA